MTNSIFDTEKRTCDRCGFDHKKSSLRKQRGLWLGTDCFDKIDKIKHPRVKWQTPRDDSNTITVPAESTPEVFTITSAGGITIITQSHELSDFRDGRHNSFFMKIVSDGGAISISADPQITAAQLSGDLLTLRGNSDTDSIKLVNGRGIRLKGGVDFTMQEGDAISFVFTTITIGWGEQAWGSGAWGGGSSTTENVWFETSRFKGGI